MDRFFGSLRFPVSGRCLSENAKVRRVGIQFVTGIRIRFARLMGCLIVNYVKKGRESVRKNGCCYPTFADEAYLE
jgi:hypothetical protein